MSTVITDVTIKGKRLAPLQEFESTAQWLAYIRREREEHHRKQNLINILHVLGALFVATGILAAVVYILS
jgi:hypothetical protein